jgi:hypothetical protein
VVSARRNSSALWGNVRQWLNATYPERWTGRGELIAWPRRSPDIIPTDFLLWGHLKEHVYTVPLRTNEDLVARLQAAVTTTVANMLGHVRQNAVLTAASKTYCNYEAPMVWSFDSLRHLKESFILKSKPHKIYSTIFLNKESHYGELMREFRLVMYICVRAWGARVCM